MGEIHRHNHEEHRAGGNRDLLPGRERADWKDLTAKIQTAIDAAKELPRNTRLWNDEHHRIQANYDRASDVLSELPHHDLEQAVDVYRSLALSEDGADQIFTIPHLIELAEVDRPTTIWLLTRLVSDTKPEVQQQAWDFLKSYCLHTESMEVREIWPVVEAFLNSVEVRPKVMRV